MCNSCCRCNSRHIAAVECVIFNVVQWLQSTVPSDVLNDGHECTVQLSASSSTSCSDCSVPYLQMCLMMGTSALCRFTRHVPWPVWKRFSHISTVVHGTSVVACMGYHLSNSSVGFLKAQSSTQSCSSCILLNEQHAFCRHIYTHDMQLYGCMRPSTTYDLEQCLSAYTTGWIQPSLTKHPCTCLISWAALLTSHVGVGVDFGRQLAPNALSSVASCYNSHVLDEVMEQSSRWHYICLSLTLFWGKLTTHFTSRYCYISCLSLYLPMLSKLLLTCATLNILM